MAESAAPARSRMSQLSREDWRDIMALLDTALEMDAAARPAWLASLGPEHERLKPMLDELLQDHSLADPDATLGGAVRQGANPRSMPAPRSLIGPYRVLREIGQGGMASVWLAERADGLLARHVALKLPHIVWGNSSLAERMARERNILGSLSHPHIARLYDVGTADDGRPFLALEYVDGLPIDLYARSKGLGIAARVELVVQVARAVAHAHTQLVVHRDLKPSNILVDGDGHAKLLDFGISKLIAAADDEFGAEATITQAHGRAYTAEYASPEQIRGDLIGTASDIYSLGIVIFELLTGSRPYRLPRGVHGVALAEALAQSEAPMPSDVAGDAAVQRQLKGDLDAIVARALRKAPADRYATVDALADDLERHLRGEPVKARPDSPWYRIERWVRRHKLETAVAIGIVVAVPAGAAAQAAVLVALGAGATVALWQMRAARKAAHEAKSEAARAEQVKTFALSMLQAANTDSGAGAATTAADVLMSAQARIETELAGRNDISVELMTSIGDGLLGLGRLEEAASVLRRAVELGESELGPRHRHMPAAWVAYASVLVNLDRTSEAVPLLLRGISEARRQNTVSPLVDGLRWLSSCKLQEGDLAAGVAYSQDAVDVVRAAGKDARKLDTVNAWASLASSLDVAQRAGLAEAARHALVHAKELYGERMTEALLSVRLLLAKGLASEDRDVEALAELESIFVDTISLLGPVHMKMEAIANFRGHVRLNVGDIAGAIEDFNLQIATTKRKSGDSGVNLAIGYTSLGKAFAAARRHEEAFQSYELSARLLREATDANNVFALRASSAAALMLAHLGRLDEADAAFEALAGATWAGGEVERVAHRGRVSVLRRLQGRHAESVMLAQESADALRSHPSKAVRTAAIATFGTALLAAGRARDAVVPLEEAAGLYNAKQMHMSPDRADAIAALAEARAQLGVDGNAHSMVANQSARTQLRRGN